MFDTKTDTIYIPVEVADVAGEKEVLIETVAHEFAHLIQKINKEEYSEEEAEGFAQTTLYHVKRRIAEGKAQIKGQGIEAGAEMVADFGMTPEEYIKEIERKGRKKNGIGTGI